MWIQGIASYVELGNIDPTNNCVKYKWKKYMLTTCNYQRFIFSWQLLKCTQLIIQKQIELSWKTNLCHGPSNCPHQNPSQLIGYWKSQGLVLKR